MTNGPGQLPLGDLKFYDNNVPGLFAGNYWVTVTHTLSQGKVAVNKDDLGATQEFVVSAPQFTLQPTEIVSRHPPDSSSGQFGEQLPHVVFREPSLPWERSMADKTATEPWLALLVLTENELIGGTNSTTRTNTASVQDFLKPDTNIYKPKVTREDDVDPASACTFIKVSTKDFTAIVPRLGELRFLAHCRQANISDKAAQSLDPDGFFSVVVANRFPAAPAVGATAPTKNVVHLVSLEGLDAVLVDSPDFGTCTSVALVSLASWTFECKPDKAADFRDLINALVNSEMAGSAYQPDKLWLHIPLPTPAGSGPAEAEMTQRLQQGFAPLSFHTRTGEDSFAWYRGPFAPVLTAPVAQNGPFLTADAAIAFQSSHGVFDMSLGAAWTAGRAVALSDKAFGQKLLDFRRRTHLVTDQLLNRLHSKCFFSQAQIDSLSHDATVEDEFLSVLDTSLLDAIGAAPVANPAATPAGAGPIDPKAAVEAFVADPTVQQKVAALVHDDLQDIAQWLARLLLLYPVPFSLLVPDERMLPVESLRFFYLDNNWTRALLDGALSIGLESSRQTFFHSVMHGTVHAAAIDAAKTYRQSLTGAPPPASEENIGEVSGLLLRSALVSGWPNLAVRPYLNNKSTLKVLRMDHLSPTVLLCLFWGVPDYVEISEPQEGFRFGVDDDGNATLRNVVPPAASGAPQIGQQIGNPFRVYDASGHAQDYMRAAGSRVLNLSPASPTGLVQSISAALTKAGGGPGGAFGPADFALQMVKAPEAIIFASGTS